MQFSVGWVLSRSFSILFKNFIPFMLLATVVHLPTLIYTYFTMGQIETSADPERTVMIWGIVVSVGGMLLGLITSGALIYGVVAELRGAHASIGESLSVGLQRFVPVLGTGLLVGLCVLGGMILLVIPGVIFSLMFYVAVPVAVIEKPGVAAALSRSKQLTDGFKSQIFGMSFLIGLLNGLVGFILEKTMLSSLTGLKVYAFASVAAEIFFAALLAVVAGVTYATLRKDRDGIDAEELARVFH